MRHLADLLVSVIPALATACTLAVDPDDGPPDGDGDPVATHGERVVGYYPSWATYERDYQVAEVPGDLLTHVNYAFVNIDETGACAVGDPYGDLEKVFPGDGAEPGAPHGNFHQLTLLKARFPHLRVLLSIGGYSWSTAFSALAATEAGRGRFAASCADLMERHGFDGLDVDWEYPGGGGEAPGVPADTANFTALLAAMRAELDARGEFLLTAAVPASVRLVDQIEVERIHEHLDWLNLMAYDFHGGWETTTNFNAPLAAVAGDPSPMAGVFHVEGAVDAYLERGCPAGKLNVGMPFYGRGWAGVGPTAEGLYQPASGAATVGTWEPGTFDWHDVAQNYLPRLTRHWSEEAQVPWLYDAATMTMISYDDPESLAAKARLVRDRGLGGAMAWDLSGDDGGNNLLHAIVDELAR